MDVQGRVDRVLREQLGEGFAWDRNTSLREKGGLELDSLDIVELTMNLENEFGIRIPDDAACMSFDRVGDITDWIARELDRKPALFAA